MHPLFVVAAGGTGAKIVESLVHLCAAGLGPDQLHVLLLDVDKDNGNVERARDAAELYARLRAWDWTLSPRSDAKGGTVPLAGTRFFKTDLHLFPCLDKISAVGEGGLSVHLRSTAGAHHLLDLLYNEAEQGSECEKGFLARPNLGSLVLGGHLREKLNAKGGGAAEFKTHLLNALNGAAVNNPVTLIVAGSIFGGTGASLFPVVCGSLRDAIDLGQNGSANWDKLAPAAVMLTPYFLPNHTAADPSPQDQEETVDPSRFLVDTANALKHYVDTTVLGDFKAVYLIGNDQPHLTRLKFVDGARDQANPPLVEEVVAALAVFDAGRSPMASSRSRRIYQPPSGLVEWTSLPFADQGAPRLALLLELASFLLLPAQRERELSGGLLDACQFWSDEFDLLPWYQRLLGGWAESTFSHSYHRAKPGGGWAQLADANILPGDAAASKARDLLAEYSYRLLLWTRTALPDADPCRLVKMGEDNMDYALVWEVMCGLTPEEIQPAGAAHAGAGDNALVRLTRAAAVAMAKIAAGQHPRGGLVNKGQTLPGFPGRGEAKDRPCALPIAQTALPDLAQRYNINTDVHHKYVKTEVPS